jgi:hypothetical protein
VQGHVTVFDINAEMLEVGKKRAQEQGGCCRGSCAAAAGVLSKLWPVRGTAAICWALTACQNPQGQDVLCDVTSGSYGCVATWLRPQAAET